MVNSSIFFQPRLAVVDILQVARKALVDCAAALCAKLCNNRLHCSTALYPRQGGYRHPGHDLLEQRLPNAFIDLDFADRMFLGTNWDDGTLLPRAEVKPPYTAPLLIATWQPTSMGFATPPDTSVRSLRYTQLQIPPSRPSSARSPLISDTLCVVDLTQPGDRLAGGILCARDFDRAAYSDNTRAAARGGL